MKKVFYNGGTEAMYSCDNPSCLVIGKEYEVLYEHADTWQTNYVLKGVDGEFNSAWFTNDSDTNQQSKDLPVVYLAAARYIPVVGKRFRCDRLEPNNGINNFRAAETSEVMFVKQLGENVWAARTRSGSVYIATIG